MMDASSAGPSSAGASSSPSAQTGIGYPFGQQSVEGALGVDAIGDNDWLAHHQQMRQAGSLEARGGSRATANTVRASLGLVVRGSDGAHRLIRRVIERRFESGERHLGRGGATALRQWLVGQQILSSGTDYQATLHAHSEQAMVLYLRSGSNLANLIEQILADRREGDAPVGVVLDIASQPNTVCSVCHQSVDALLNRTVLPAFSAALHVSDLPGVVQATAPNQFSGSGPRSTDTATWVEPVVDFRRGERDEPRGHEQRPRCAHGATERSSQ